jgi:hypothetical protein
LLSCRPSRVRVGSGRAPLVGCLRSRDRAVLPGEQTAQIPSYVL